MQVKTNLNEWLKKTATFRNNRHKNVREHMVLNDGTTLSVQASSGHYCEPRKSYLDYWESEELEYFDYSKVEVWCVSCDTPDSWKEYGDQEDNPYAYIPVSMVEEFIDEHGGIKE